MPRGGKRPGAGRPKGSKEKGTLAKEAAREALRLIVTEHMREMAEAQIAAAKGTKYLVYRNKLGGEFRAVTKAMIDEGILEKENVTIEVWDKQPSTPAFTDLMNRALDKPKEQEQEVKITGEAELLALLIDGRKRVAEAK
jgi:hypothetical protein